MGTHHRATAAAATAVGKSETRRTTQRRRKNRSAVAVARRNTSTGRGAEAAKSTREKLLQKTTDAKGVYVNQVVDRENPHAKTKAETLQELGEAIEAIEDKEHIKEFKRQIEK